MIALEVLAVLVTLYLLGAFSESGSKGVAGKANTWAWLNNKESKNVDWNERRDRVRDAFVISWDAYEKHAWGKNVLTQLVLTLTSN